MNEDAIETLRELILGRELMIELEEVVMKHLEPDMEKFQNRDTNVPWSMRRVRQYLDSRNNIKLWKSELAAFALSINQLKREPSQCQ